jgi:hypothetical protein
MLLAEFFPEQFESQVAVLCQLLPDVVEVGLCPCREFRRRLSGRKQGPFQTIFVPFITQRPLQPGGFHARQILVNRALAGVDAARDLPLTELLLEVQPQNLFDLSHGLSLSGQLRPALLWADPWSPVVSSPAPPFSSFSFHSDHRSPIPITSGPKAGESDRNQRRTLIGFTGERRSESRENQ